MNEVMSLLQSASSLGRIALGHDVIVQHCAFKAFTMHRNRAPLGSCAGRQDMAGLVPSAFCCSFHFPLQHPFAVPLVRRSVHRFRAPAPPHQAGTVSQVCSSLHVSRFKSPAFNALQVTPDQWQRFDCTLPKEAATDEPNFQDSTCCVKLRPDTTHDLSLSLTLFLLAGLDLIIN